MKVISSNTRLLVSDLKACFEFYRDVMEFQVIIESIYEGYAELIAGDMKLALFRRQEMAQMIGNTQMPFDAQCQDKVVLIFTVPDLEAAHHQLKYKGMGLR